MGKQVRQLPEETLDEQPLSKSSSNGTTPAPELDEQPVAVKKKEQSAVKSEVSTADSLTPGKPSSESGVSKWEALGEAIKVISPVAKPLYDFGRRMVSGVVDDIPKATAQGLEVARSSVSPANVQEFIKTQRPRDFQKYVREKEGIKWYEAFEIDKYLSTHADAFMADTGLQEIADRITQNTPEVVKRRLEVEQFVQEQNQDSATKLAGTIQDYRDIKSVDDVASYVATLGGQAAYQIPLAIATRGASSLIQESAAVYDKQLDNIAKDKGISREEVIKQNLDDPARGQAYAVLAAALDAVSAGNILKVFRQGATDGLFKRWLKSAGPEIITEPTQGVLETVGGSTGDKVAALSEALTDPDRINEAIGGLIGGSAGVFGASPVQTVQAVSEKVDAEDQQNLAAKAEVIQASVDQHEADVIAGQPELQSPTPTPDDQATQVAPDAVIEEQPISKTQAQEEVQAQADTQVAQEGGVAPATTEQNVPKTLYIPEQEQGTYNFERPVTQTQDAVQEQGAEVVDVGEPSRDGGAVEQGNIRPQEPAGEEIQEGQGEEITPSQSQISEDVNQPKTLYGDPSTREETTGSSPNADRPVDPGVDSKIDEGVRSEVAPQQQATPGQAAPPTVPPDQETGAEPIERTPQERTTYARIKNDPNISKEIKQGIAQEAKTYVPRNLKRVTEREADAIIDAKGLDESVKMYLDDSERLYPDVDTAIGFKLFERLQAADNISDAIRVFEKYSIRGTELGQAVNAYKIMQGKTMINVVQKSITKARKTFKEKNEWRSQDAKSQIDKINTGAIEKVLKSPKFQTKLSSEVKKGNVKKAIDFLEGLKVDTKGKALDVVYGISAAAWNTVITAVQKGLQAGLTISQAINKAVNAVKEPAFDKKEATNFLDEKLKDYRVSLDPSRAIKAELAATGKKIDDIIRQHYSEQASTKKELIDKLVKDGNVSADQAQAITDELSQEFDKLTRAAKEKALNKLLPKPPKNVTPKERKDTVDELIEQSNYGALSEEQYADAIADKLGVPKLSEQQLKDIQGLTDKVQKAKGDSAKSKAAQDLLNYVENLKGWDWIDAVQAIWYANILSGPTTLLITNPFANLTNLMAEASIDIARNPKDAAFIMGRIGEGLVKGMIKAKDVLSTGYNPYKGQDYKTEAKPLLERIEFKGAEANPLNWLKYVSRALKAGDILFFEALKEQRLAVLAVREAKKHGRDKPSHDDMHNLRQQLIKEDYDAAYAQAASEGFSGTPQRVRAYEILEAMRPEYAMKEAEGFAARGTFNIKPEGYLGRVAENLNKMRQDIPALNYVVPFVNTIINVANEYVNYMPVLGHYRAFKGTADSNPERSTFRRYSNEERAKIALKATSGLFLMMALGALDDPDDEDNFVEITANLTGDLQKNFELEKQGKRPYSIRVGDTWISYKNTPWAMPLASMGYYKDSQRYRKDPTFSEGLTTMAIGSFGFLMDLSALSGLSDLVKMLTVETLSEQGNAGQKVLKFFEKTAKSIAIPNYFTQISRLVQELTETPIKRADQIGDSIFRDIPILRDRLGNMYDAYGDPVIPKQLEKLIPLNVHRTPEDIEMLEFLSNNKLFVGRPSSSNLKPNGTPMTEEEYRDWSVAAAKAIKSRLKREYKMYTREKNREVIQSWFDRVKQEERTNAKFKTFGYF